MGLMISTTSSANGAKPIGQRVRIAFRSRISRTIRVVSAEDKGRFCPAQRPRTALGFWFPVLAWCRQRFGFLGDIGSMGEPQASRDRRSVGQEPGLDARMGHPDCSRILQQFKVAPALQLFQLTGVVSLGVDDKRQTRLIRCSTPDASRTGPSATGLFRWRDGSGLRRTRIDPGRLHSRWTRTGTTPADGDSGLIPSPTEVGLPLTDDLDDVPRFRLRHWRTALLR